MSSANPFGHVCYRTAGAQVSVTGWLLTGWRCCPGRLPGRAVMR
jgi:hypothetical protein